MLSNKEFSEKYCDMCGTQRCGGVEDEPFRDGCYHYRLEKAKDLWDEFGDVPMNPETERIETPWHGFPTGTHREEIWHWFEDTFKVRVHDLMYQ